METLPVEIKVKTLQQIRREARREDVRKPCNYLLQQHKIHLTGHFDLGNGECSTEYMNPHAILDTPSHVWQLAQCLIDLSVDANEADIAAGPLMGGALLAYVMSALLGSKGDPGDPAKRFVPLHPAPDSYEIRDHYRQLLPGKRVWLVDDVCRTGNTLSWCAAAIEEAGGRVIATSVILQNVVGMRIRDRALKGVHHEYIQTFSAGSVKRDDCEQCRDGVEFTQF